MKKIISILAILLCFVTSYGQIKSDLSFLDRTKLNQITKATKFGYKSNYNGINYRVLYVVNGAYKDWFIEFENERDYSVSFRYAIGDENRYLNKGWSFGNLRAKESKIIPLKYNLNFNDNYSVYVTIGALKNEGNEKYEYGRLDMAEIGSNILCSYCALFAKDDYRCPEGEVDMESIEYNTDAYVGDEYTETELGKIKGTIPLSDGEKKNAKIDVSVQGINSLFQIGKSIKQAVDEKKELQRKEQEELLLQQQIETNRKKDEIALKLKLNSSKLEEKISFNDVVFKDNFNGQIFKSGQIIFKDGSYYDGNLNDYKKSDGKQNKGKFYFSNGDKYEGGFANQKQDGWGIYTWANGQKYTGYFSNGDILGTGTLTFTNKTYKKGYFQRTSENMGMNFDDELTKVHQTFRSSDGTQLLHVKNPLFITGL